MKYFIDYSFFIFKCLELKKGNKIIFTYKIKKEELPKIILGYFKLIQELCKSDNFQKDFLSQKNRHCYQIDNINEFDLIKEIFKEDGYKDEWIDQKILDSPSIFQIKFGNSEKRMFFILEKLILEKLDEPINKKQKKNNENYYIIKPLFLDLNHLLNLDERFPKVYNMCAVCHQARCTP